MRRYEPPSEEAWAKAIHAVTEQKLGLRQAAQLHGVHHLALHRRVRGLSSPSSPSTSARERGGSGSGSGARASASACAGPAAGAELVRRFLSESDEREVLGVLREQFHHEQRITSDDVRFVVRAVASHGGKRAIPPDFPPSRWILDFKRLHGFVKLGNFAWGAGAAAPGAALGLPARLTGGGQGRASRSSSAARVTASSNSSSEGEKEPPESATPARGPASGLARYAMPSTAYEEHENHQQQQQQQQQRRGGASWPQPSEGEELGSHTSSGSLDSENGATTGPSNSNSSSSGARGASASGGGAFFEPQESAAVSSEKRGYKLSHTVPPETWEKAIAAVEQQGLSLRAAAKMYGVHFAALHRRVKKRAQGGQAAKAHSGYFHPSDEAGIMRVVVARAELGVLMTFDELLKLVEMAALRKLPDLSVDSARRLLTRFQSRNEASIRHIIVDWPPPRPTGAASQPHLYHMEHPGYAYGAAEPPERRRAFMPRSSADSGGAATAAAVAAATPSLFEPPTRVGPPRSTAASSACSQGLQGLAASASARVAREQDSGPAHPVMFV